MVLFQMIPVSGGHLALQSAPEDSLNSQVA